MCNLLETIRKEIKEDIVIEDDKEGNASYQEDRLELLSVEKGSFSNFEDNNSSAHIFYTGKLKRKENLIIKINKVYLNTEQKRLQVRFDYREYSNFKLDS